MDFKYFSDSCQSLNLNPVILDSKHKPSELLRLYNQVLLFSLLSFFLKEDKQGGIFNIYFVL